MKRKIFISTLALLITAFLFAIGIKGINDVKAEDKYAAWNESGDDIIRNNLETLNLADATKMEQNSNVKLFGNIVSFGPSMGAFIDYKSKDKYQNVRIEAEFCFDKTYSDWQRVVLRGDDLTAEKTGGTQGYFVSLEKNMFILYKMVGASGYYQLDRANFTKEQVENDLGTLYDNKYHKFVFEIFDRANGDVVINISINDIPISHTVDNASRSRDYYNNEIPEKDRVDYSGKGYVGLYLNSTTAPWYIKGEFSKEMFSEDTYLGNSEIYASKSTASLEKGKITLRSNDYAVLSEEGNSIGAEFTINAKTKNQDGKILSMGMYTSKKYNDNYAELDGLVADIYDNKVVLRYKNTVLKEKTGYSLLNKDVDIKIITTYVAGEFLFVVGINDDFLVATERLECNTMGYFGLYGMGDSMVLAKEQEDRNYRILFIGNSITSHGPNASLNYGIGTNSAETWGMATSAPEYDYVHRVMSSVHALDEYKDAEFMAINVASWEASINAFDYVNTYQEGQKFEADLIVCKLGENAATHTPEFFTYAYYLKQLLDFFNVNNKAKVIIVTEYWGNENYASDYEVDIGNILVARNNEYPLVRIGDLGSKYALTNNATADRDYYSKLNGLAPSGKKWIDEYSGWIGGVMEHPGMTGHENIAARVSESVVNLLTGKDAYIDKYVELVPGIHAEYTTSKLYGNVPGAYDYKGCTFVRGSEIKENVSIELPKNYHLYKALNLEFDGDIYRIELDADADYNAGMTYKAFTEDESGKLVELRVYNNSDSIRDGKISIVGDFGKKLYILVEYNKNVIFQDNTLSEAKYSNVLKWINENNKNFTLDVSDLGSKYLLIKSSAFPMIVSSNKDVEIIFEGGRFVIERSVFELISRTSKDLYFSIQKLSQTNYLRNATTVVSGMTNEYGKYYFLSKDSSGYLEDVYEMKISYDSRNGEPLYLNKGVTAYLDIEIEENDIERITVINACLPSIGSKIGNVELAKDDSYYYENGTLILSISDFEPNVILAYKSLKERIEVLGNYKKEYVVGEKLSIEGMELVHVNSDGTRESISLDESMITGFDSSSAKENIITIRSGELETTITLTIKEGTTPQKKKGCKKEILGVSLIPLLLIPVALKKKKENE